MKFKSLMMIVIALNGLIACSGEDHVDVKDFMKETDANSENIRIEELPPFQAYEPFTYAAVELRSPFKTPASIDAASSQVRSDVVPDENRAKEFLEQFDIESLAFVGSMAQGQAKWALIKDAESKIHRVSVGDYLGQDHGRLSAINDESITVLEILPNGLNNWIEKPRTLGLPGQVAATK